MSYLSQFLIDTFGRDRQERNLKYFPQTERLQPYIIKNADFSRPLFIADQKIISDRHEQLSLAVKHYWGEKYSIAYSYKTNYSLSRHPIEKKLNLWSEVVSGREYQMAKKAKKDSSTIIFNGPYKTRRELSRALKEGAIVHLDNEDDLDNVNRILENSRKKLPSAIGLRFSLILPGLGESRFGFPVDSKNTLRVLTTITSHPRMTLNSVQIHIGTDVDNVSYYKIATNILNKYILQLPKVITKDLEYIDIGGGFPSHGLRPYHKLRWRPQPIDEYIKVIAAELTPLKRSLKTLTLIIEPGRYLIDDATCLVAKVISASQKDGQQTLVTNATINMLPLCRYRQQMITVHNERLVRRTKYPGSSIIYGATCQEDDVLYKGNFPKAKTDDYLIFYCVGAYNHSLGSDFIFLRPEFKII